MKTETIVDTKAEIKAAIEEARAKLDAAVAETAAPIEEQKVKPVELTEAQKALGFTIPPPKMPPPEPADQSAPDWAQTIPGSPSAPVFITLDPTGRADGWAAGGKIKYALCPPNPSIGAAGCRHYSEREDACVGPACESWRAEATTCINYKPR